MNELDLTIKENWTVENGPFIAVMLGFNFNDEFISFLEWYIDKVVSPASLTSFLQIIAKNLYGGGKDTKWSSSQTN